MPVDPHLPPPPQTVLLRHELPDGSWHFDWMLDLDPARDAPLTTFRVAERIDRLPPGGRIGAVRLDDHRRVYLTHEGPVGGDRGHVVRVASGRVEAARCIGETRAFTIDWDRAPRQTLQVTPRDGAWIVVNRDIPGGEGATILLSSTRAADDPAPPDGKDHR